MASSQYHCHAFGISYICNTVQCSAIFFHGESNVIRNTRETSNSVLYRSLLLSPSIQMFKNINIPNCFLTWSIYNTFSLKRRPLRQHRVKASCVDCCHGFSFHLLWLSLYPRTRPQMRMQRRVYVYVTESRRWKMSVYGMQKRRKMCLWAVMSLPIQRTPWTEFVRRCRVEHVNKGVEFWVSIWILQCFGTDCRHSPA